MSNTPREAGLKIKAALTAARAGRATLAQLGEAHDLAASLDLNACSAELREHVLKKLGTYASPNPTKIARDMMLGLTTGIITHHLLKRM